MFGLPVEKLRRLICRFYAASWSVSGWGWPEFRTIAGSLLVHRIDEGVYPERFAACIRDYLGVRYALPVNRARFAIELALRSLDVGPGDDVVLPSYLSRSVLAPLAKVGARPIFCDIGATLHPTVETLGRAITSQTKVVIVPHLFGNIAPIDQIERMLQGSGIALIDDAAQSFGARCSGRAVGSFGTCGVISVGPDKSLAGPAGGVLVTNDPRIYRRTASLPLDREEPSLVMRRLLLFLIGIRFRNYTTQLRRLMQRAAGGKGPCSEQASVMSNLDAAIALRQHEFLDRNAAQRRRNAKTLLLAMETGWVQSISDLSASGIVLCLALILSADGPTVAVTQGWLASIGIESKVGYSPLHQLFRGGAPLSVTEDLSRRVVFLPVTSQIRSKRSLQLLSEMRCLIERDAAKADDGGAAA